ncbi:hypothetical protein LFL96_15155 [Paraburkholderia sp. D15]|uniref:DUF6543 domain-containing protein n=1 Tax=Paraburkholderia sp. D15 TaxID=2880218 RepID=UPI00247B1DA7|nr:DUF6543 domain-containing protein [Paraburkholderia sp. D15]WGS49094.1 hypothetical protein LFL96_15155 [Paraburkholderia sp. D15]
MKVHPFGSQAAYPAHVEVARGNGAPSGMPPSERSPASREAADNGAMIHGNGEHGPATSNTRVTGEGAGQQTYAMLKNWTGAGTASEQTHMRADQATRGVYRGDNGQAFIKQGDQTYPVRYDKDNGTWRVHSPENPTKYAYPVRQDESGNWHTHSEVGLKGGGGQKPAKAEISGGPRQIVEQRIQQLQGQLQQAEARAREQLDRQRDFPNQIHGLSPQETERRWQELNAHSYEIFQRPIDLRQEIAQRQAELQQMD